MGLLAPLGLALFALSVPLVLLYLLKHKREDRVVPSTLLWSKVVQDLKARHPFQRLRANLLLLLQLLALALLAVALARPVVRATAERARAVAIVLDVSASMLAEDVAGGGTRFEAARAAARELLKNLRGADRAMVVLAGRAARTAKALTADREELLRALDAARAEETRGELRDAVLLAAAALRPLGPAGEVHVFGDGGGGEVPSEAEARVALRFQVFGESGENAGLTGLDVVRGRGPPGAETEERVEIFATVENAGGERARRFLTLYHEATAIASRALDLAPGTEEAVVFREAVPPGRIALRLDGRDALAADDAAYAVLTPRAPIGVAIVGTSHGALERALEKAGRGPWGDDVEIFNFGAPGGGGGGGGAAAAGARPPFRDDPRYRLVIYDSVEPGELPAKPVLVFGARAALPGVKVGPEVEAPEVTGWERDHPLLRFVDLGGLAIAKARTLEMDGPGRPLIRSDRGLLALESRARRDPLVVIGIDIRESTWAAEEAFPVFVLNVLQLVRRAGGELGPERIEAGEVLPVRAPGPDVEVALVRPSGERVVRRARQGPGEAGGSGARADFLETGATGFYAIEAGGRAALVASNLLDRGETLIEPRAALAAGDAEIRAEPAIASANREVWRWFALVALGALIVEWWAFHRRV